MGTVGRSPFGRRRRLAADNGVMTTPAYSSELARLAALLADRTRAAFCLALLDGRAWTAGELAAYAQVAPSTASEHLTRLTDGGLLVERRQGRHRYVQLAGPRVAELLESLTAHLAPPAEPPRGLRAASASAALARGRTCYDHLAGRLGVTITDAMTGRGLLDQDGGFALTDTGRNWLTDGLGIEPPHCARGGGHRPAPAWTGPSAAPISRARPAPGSATGCWSDAGSAGSAAAGPYASPRTERRRCTTCWGSMGRRRI